ncbi:serine/threonine-protein kinase CBK1-like [Cucumis melo]|uniref:Serine/threonine-protein kinase CBK1-like n=1 Tax=Cucumis melo TaxID=3656 RepID=A0A1S3BVS9_CUCME|nr:serine/threonine-protein kinase CBK1-like [Cucumis melo]XP_050943803.1 serine/threonine-protein kinase CBK1-like [Cucumis melo]XP_050943804.1 serine/threonine-protein kinase CBK1-like [Cucumis melo]
MYEMLVDCPPFYSDDPITSCRKIVHWKNHLKFPEDAKLIIEAKDLICRLYWRSIPNQSIHYNNQAFTVGSIYTRKAWLRTVNEDAIDSQRSQLCWIYIQEFRCCQRSITLFLMLLIPKDLSFVGYTCKNFDAVKGGLHSFTWISIIPIYLNERAIF